VKFQGSYVYIVTNKQNGTLYLGVTADLQKRIWEHKNHTTDGFSSRYDLNMLVWYEIHDDINSAINREKQLKKWERKWKLRIIEEMNPEWLDLYEGLF